MKGESKHAVETNAIVSVHPRPCDDERIAMIYRWRTWKDSTAAVQRLFWWVLALSLTLALQGGPKAG